MQDGASRVTRECESQFEKEFHVRWQYLTRDQKIWALHLGDSKDDLKSSLVGEFQPLGSMANVFGKADEWSRFEFEFDEAEAGINDLPVASNWNNGISVDTTRCKALGMRKRFVDMLDNGTDLLLDKMPLFDVSRDNYSSALDEIDTTTAMIEEQAASGVLESKSIHRIMFYWLTL